MAGSPVLVSGALLCCTWTSPEQRGPKHPSSQKWYSFRTWLQHAEAGRRVKHALPWLVLIDLNGLVWVILEFLISWSSLKIYSSMSGYYANVSFPLWAMNSRQLLAGRLILFYVKVNGDKAFPSQWPTLLYSYSPNSLSLSSPGKTTSRLFFIYYYYFSLWCLLILAAAVTFLKPEVLSWLHDGPSRLSRLWPSHKGPSLGLVSRAWWPQNVRISFCIVQAWDPSLGSRSHSYKKDFHDVLCSWGKRAWLFFKYGSN